VVPSGVERWKLSSEGGHGLSCTDEGLFLGRTALIERRERGYHLRPPTDLERLFWRALAKESRSTG
jgi:hypothetical protein